MTTITNQNTIYLCITAVLLFLLPILVFAYWKLKCGKGVKISPVFIGAVGFLVSARVLEMIPHLFCIVLDTPVSRFINGSTLAYVLYGIFMAGIFEECGRYVILKYLWKKEKTKNDVIMYGIGHGGIEVWAVSMPAIVLYLAVAVMVQTMGLDGTLAAMKVTAGQAEIFQTTVVDVATGFGAGMAVMTILERIIAMVLHLSLTGVVYYGVRENKKHYLFIAVLAHAVFDLFPALYQRKVVPMWACEVWIFVCAVLCCCLTRYLYQKKSE